MKPRRVRINLEVETDAPMDVLQRAASYAELTVYEPREPKLTWRIVVLQALADVQQAQKTDKKLKRA